ncbi:translation initiation factor IF-3 [Gammaproteobacteria bacterium]
MGGFSCQAGFRGIESGALVLPKGVDPAQKHRPTVLSALRRLSRKSSTDRRTIISEKRNRLNDEITARQVLVIDAEGQKIGVLAVHDAQRMADEREMDLVEIVPTVDPPVCRIMNFGKFVFDQKKQKQAAKKKQKVVEIKEIKFRPGTDDGDYQVKLRNLKRFLEDGDKAKVTMRFRGREHAHRELGLELLKRVETDLAEISAIEQQPEMEGRQMVMVLGPKKKR